MNQEQINKLYADLCTQYGNLCVSKKRIEAQIAALEHRMEALDHLVPSLLKSSQKPGKREGATNE